MLSTHSTKDIRYHPYFPGGISRWGWRFLTHRVTPAGRWFFGVCIVFLLQGSTSLDLQVYVPFVYAMGVWAVALVFALLLSPRVTLVARHADRVGAGETLPVDIELAARGRQPFASLTVLPSRLPPALDAVPPDGIELPLPPDGKRVSGRLGILCERRGRFRLRPFRVQSDFPLGLLRAYAFAGNDATLLVYPQFSPLTALTLPVGRSYQPGGIALASHLGKSLEFIGDREFREGDNVRDMDWRASARLDRLVVREYREEYFYRVAVILDTHVPGGTADGEENAPFERAVSLCAAVSDALARQEYLVDLFAAGPNLYHLAAGRSLAYQDQILDILAVLEATPAEPLNTLEPEVLDALGQITTVICLLLDWNSARRAFAERLSATGAALKIVVVRDGPPTLDPEGEGHALGSLSGY